MDSGVGDFLNMDPEQRQQAEENMRNELAKVGKVMAFLNFIERSSFKFIEENVHLTLHSSLAISRNFPFRPRRRKRSTL